MIENFINSQNFILFAVFLSATTFFVFGYLLLRPVIDTRRRLANELVAEGAGNKRALTGRSDLKRISTRLPVETYFKTANDSKNGVDTLQAKLFRAGFHHPNAIQIYQFIRLFASAAGFAGAYVALDILLPPTLPNIFGLVGASVFGLAMLVVPSVALDRFENRQKKFYRRAFPDFMDLMITCADAGMSLEAAVSRVSEEISGTHRGLGIQLAIMTLQMRAGKPLRESLRELAERIDIDEARSLAVLFRQSEELGTSLTEALRVYSDEMRTERILAAEEKANALPVKMVLPLGLCIFPVVMMIIMLPVFIRMRGVFF